MLFLIVGYGSIGRRHARNVERLGHQVVLLRHSKQRPNSAGFREYFSLSDALGTETVIDGVIICNPTSEHAQTVETAIEFNLPFLVEKPLTDNLNSAIAVRDLIRKNEFRKYDIAFNLRQYPILKYIKGYLPQLGKVFSVRVDAGYYLPFWRPDDDYRNTTSAQKALGGGVHKEMVHEIDYVLWLFGVPDRLMGYVGKISDLEIDTEDICSAILLYDSGIVVELHLDYLSHKYRRGLQIICETGTLEWSFPEGEIVYYSKDHHNRQTLFSLDESYDFNETYLMEIEKFVRIIHGNSGPTVDADDAFKVTAVVEAIAESSRQKRMVPLSEVVDLGIM